MNLPFTSVKTILDDIPKEQHGFWALGKIYAYKAQKKPFVHLDNDAILWKGLPEWALNSEVFVQNTEDAGWFTDVYMPEVNHANKILKYFPPNWNITKEAFCTGIFGGCDIDFIHEYCDEALRFINDKKNPFKLPESYASLNSSILSNSSFVDAGETIKKNLSPNIFL